MASRDYRVYCVTEGANVFVSSSTVPTSCPNNGGHTIGGVNIIDDYIEGSQIFGDGSDGNVTVSVNTTLVRDMYYKNLTITSGALLDADGFRVFVADTLTITNGWIHNDGVSGFVGTGASNTVHTLGFGASGGAGGIQNTAGTNGSTVTAATMMGGVGGNGGTGNVGAAGTAGASQLPPDTAGGLGWFRCAEIAICGRNPTLTILNGGTGGGGGGGGSSPGQNGGTGGGGAGVVMVIARFITVTTGGIRANGGPGSHGASNGGGGGGGGGGCVVVISTVDLSGFTITATGGTFGNLGGAGTNGVAGSNGNVYLLRI